MFEIHLLVLGHPTSLPPERQNYILFVAKEALYFNAVFTKQGKRQAFVPERGPAGR